MQGNALARKSMLPVVIAIIVAIVWSLWPTKRTIALHVDGIPAWSEHTIALGRQPATLGEEDEWTVTVTTGEHSVHVRGGLDTPCTRCCYALDLPVEIHTNTARLPLLATVPDCPTADYPVREAGVGAVDIGGVEALIRRHIFMGEPVSRSLWAWGGAGGCGEVSAACVPWLEVILFANRLSISEGLTPAYYHDEAHLFPYSDRGGAVHWMRDADGWRLPTEAEWLHGVSEPVGWEWTWDTYSDPYDGVERIQDADGPRTVRGPEGRSARVAPSDDLGFRLVRDVPPEPPVVEGELIRPHREFR